MNEADGGARADAQLVNARWAAPTSTVHRAPGAPAGGGETAGQHRWVQHLSEDTNKVEMVKAMGHGAGKGQTKYGRRKTRKADKAGRVRGASEPPSPGPGAGELRGAPQKGGRRGLPGSMGARPGPRVSRRPSKV